MPSPARSSHTEREPPSGHWPLPRSLYVAILGVHGPVAVPYGWIVRNVPESGVFRELYDLAGVMAALIVLLACAAIARVRWLGYVVLAVGIALADNVAVAAAERLVDRV